MPTNLKRIRVAKGLTQQDVYEPAGIAKSYYSALENGKRDLNERLIGRLCKVLNIEPYMLIIDSEAPGDAQFIEDLAQLSADQRDLVRRMVADLAAAKKQKPE